MKIKTVTFANRNIIEIPFSKVAFLLQIVGLYYLSACGPQANHTSQIFKDVKTNANSSDLNTVDIPQTAVRNQGRFGICWSYGTIGLLESIFKSRTQKDVDLSEEAVVFFHMAEGLHALFQTSDVATITSVLSKGAFPEGWNARIPEWLQNPRVPGERKQHDGLDIVKIYGAFPESAWSFKVPDGAARTAFFKSMASNISQLMMRSVDMKKLTLEEVMDKVLIGRGAFPSRPPAIFEYDGRNWNSNSFLTDYLQINTDDFQAVIARSEDDYDKVITAAKRAMVEGFSVPLAFPINISRLHGDLFTGQDVSDPKDWVSFAKDGGHLVLATDFVNKGGVAGAMSSPFIFNELRRSPSDLDTLIFKNSWGIGSKTNEAGTEIGNSPSGIYRMDQSYLRGTMRVPTLTRSPYNTVQVVVPKHIADNPL